jgi:hypothetical protein
MNDIATEALHIKIETLHAENERLQRQAAAARHKLLANGYTEAEVDRFFSY